MIKVGFIGVGDMGLGQARSFAEITGKKRCEVVAASDIAAPARKRFAENFPGAAVYEDYNDLLADTNVDAVVTALPTWFHKDVCTAVMKSGRPVMTEKPMGRTVAHCRKMIDASEKTGQLLMVAQCRRYDADWGTWGKIITDGTIGSPVLWRHVAAGRGPAKGWFVDDKLGGGPLLDGAVHNHDFANYLFGDPEYVVAQSIKLTSATCVDTCTAVVHYPGGNQLMLNWSWGVATGAHAIDVLGTTGTINWGPGPFASDSLDNSYGYYHVMRPAPKKPKLYKFKRKNMYVEQAKHFLDCIEGKAECRSPATEAIKGVAVAEAILKAGPKGGSRKVSW